MAIVVYRVSSRTARATQKSLFKKKSINQSIIRFYIDIKVMLFEIFFLKNFRKGFLNPV